MKLFNQYIIMKRLSYTLWSLSVLFIAIGITSCSNEDAPEADVISNEIKAQFESLGFDVSDIEIVNEEDPFSGKLQEFYVLEGDIKITESQMLEMAASDIHHIGAVGEQYRTTNLVNNNRTISVLGFTGGSIVNLDNTMRTALQMAVENFNNLNIGLTFNLTFGSTNVRSFDIVVSRAINAPSSSEFPSGGNTGRNIQIQSGISNLGVDLIEGLITHEMGHALGLRHTDFFNRSLSCDAGGGNEGDAGIGAIHIPGTPTGFDPNSIMVSCLDRDNNGEFSNFDVIALEFLY